MKTPLLSSLFLLNKDSNHNQLFSDETQAIKIIAKRLSDTLKDVSPKEKVDFENLLYDYGSENYYLGCIDGFKMCKRLMNELESIKDDDFLRELLISDIPPYFSSELKDADAVEE